MGRHAKYFSNEDRIVAAKLKQKERRQTPHGKALIKAQRYTTYHKVHGRQGSSTLSQPLPRDLLAATNTSLPKDSNLFCQALQSSQLLDETGLDLWDTGPPYPTGVPSNTPDELRFTARLEEVMHGRYARMLEERRIQESNLSLDARKARLDEALDNWHIAQAFLEVYEDGDREVRMAHLWVEWLARCVKAYHHDWHSKMY